MKTLKLFILSTLILLPSFVYAVSSDLVINLDPGTPAPYEKVTLSLVSYSLDIDNSLIVWTASGKKIYQGIGAKTFSVQAGGVGQDIPVTVTVTSPTGKVTASINITPQSVDLVWETPESYVPPFYEGKSLPGEGADVRVTALPSISVNGKQFAASNLSYSWYVNDELIGSASGQGRQTAILGLDYLSTKTDIKVSVRAVGGQEASKTITIYPHKVLPLLYTYDDVLGTNFSQQIVRRLETAKDITISLVPFFLSARKGLEQTANYSWILGGQSVTPPEKTLLALHPVANSSGSKPLQILISNSMRRLQDTEFDLDIIFDTRK
jgi:hypothetical protein